jgi:hypothetical protein
LDIIVEAQELGAILGQDLGSIVIAKVLKLHQYIRPSLVDRMDKFINEIVVLFTRQIRINKYQKQRFQTHPVILFFRIPKYSGSFNKFSLLVPTSRNQRTQ